MRFLAVVVTVLLAAGGAARADLAAERSPPSTADIDAAARRVLDRRYQTQLPIAPPATGDGTKLDRQGKGKPRGAPARPRTRAERDQDGDGDLRAGGALAGAMRLLVYVVLGVAAALALLWLLRDLRRGPADATLGGEPVAEPTVDQGVLERPVGDADELARAGRFADAIHTLLLRTLVELVRATRTRVPASLTSREILARVPLVPDARAALEGLVGAVELTWFGDEVPGPLDYDRCRREFQRFADAYREGR